MVNVCIIIGNEFILIEKRFFNFGLISGNIFIFIAKVIKLIDININKPKEYIKIFENTLNTCSFL